MAEAPQMNRAMRRAAAKANRTAGRWKEALVPPPLLIEETDRTELKRVVQIQDGMRTDERTMVRDELGGDRSPETLADLTENALGFTDEILQKQPPVACRAGCAWCCHLEVQLTGAEVFYIAETIRRAWTGDEQASLVERLRAAWARIGSTPRVPDRPYLACPLLHENRCRAYEQRPLACRRWTSPDASLCEQALHDDRVTIEQNLLFFWSTGGIYLGLRDGLRDLGLDRPIELVDGLLVALTVPDALGRWLAGEAIFTEWRAADRAGASDRTNGDVRDTKEDA
jgi:Fe-S-cluster containining protein